MGVPSTGLLRVTGQPTLDTSPVDGRLDQSAVTAPAPPAVAKHSSAVATWMNSESLTCTWKLSPALLGLMLTPRWSRPVVPTTVSRSASPVAAWGEELLLSPALSAVPPDAVGGTTSESRTVSRAPPKVAEKAVESPKDRTRATSALAPLLALTPTPDDVPRASTVVSEIVSAPTFCRTPVPGPRTTTRDRWMATFACPLNAKPPSVGPRSSTSSTVLPPASDRRSNATLGSFTSVLSFSTVKPRTTLSGPLTMSVAPVGPALVSNVLDLPSPKISTPLPEGLAGW